jgi:hypothetical protein
VKKQESLAQGNRDFQLGEYPIFYGRVLQIDSRLSEVHYELERTHRDMGSFAAANQESLRTIGLQLENWAAQRHPGRLQLAAGRRKEARERSRREKQEGLISLSGASPPGMVS